MAARFSIRLGPLIGALLLPIVPGLAGGATDAQSITCGRMGRRRPTM